MASNRQAFYFCMDFLFILLWCVENMEIFLYCNAFLSIAVFIILILIIFCVFKDFDELLFCFSVVHSEVPLGHVGPCII